MEYVPQFLLIGAVTGVGVLHTLVPDHWAPIMVIARQRRWSKSETARAALLAGSGHVFSTLIIGVIVWIAGVAVAARFGEFVETASGLLLIAFGGWMALSSWRELHDANEDAHGRAHAHDHGGIPHSHAADDGTQSTLQGHRHMRSSRTALLLILGSSPMVEGIPTFFAAGKYGPGLIVTMAVCFAISTIATYVAVTVYSTATLRRLHFGALERYGEVLSGTLIAVVGLVFIIWSVW